MSNKPAKRAERRGQALRMKNRARRIRTLWFAHLCADPNADERQLGLCASTHCRPCSGAMDQPGNEVPPRRERRFYDTVAETGLDEPPHRRGDCTDSGDAYGAVSMTGATA